jgi:zinc/manganese transport system permease protein
MMNTWIAASVVAVIAGVTGFFAVLRGSTFAAHAIPNGAFAGAAGAGLLGINVIWGLAVFAIAGALGIGALGRPARHDVVTALMLVLMLGLGALFVSFSTEYAETAYSLLFGEVFGVSSTEVLPILGLGVAAIAAIGFMFRPLMLTSAMPEVADAHGVSTRRYELAFLLVMALATSMTIPVVGALLMFSLMIGPAAAARSVTARPGVAMGLAVAIALVTVWAGIVLSYRTNWPLGFFVGVFGAAFFMLGRGYAAVRVRLITRLALPGSSSLEAEGLAQGGGGEVDGGLGGVGLAQGVEHDEVVDDALVADRGHRDSGRAELAGVGLAFVAKDVGLAGDHQGRRQPGQLLGRGTQRGGGDPCPLVLVSGVLVPEPLHGVPAQEVAGGELLVGRGVEPGVGDRVQEHLRGEGDCEACGVQALVGAVRRARCTDHPDPRRRCPTGAQPRHPRRDR